MSKTKKTTVTLDSPAAIRKFVNGPCTQEALQLLEGVGIFNLQSEEFDNAINALDEMLGSDDDVQGIITALLHSEGPIDKATALTLGKRLDNSHIDDLMRRSEAAYLLGLAVGRQIGGAR